MIVGCKPSVVVDVVAVLGIDMQMNKSIDKASTDSKTSPPDISSIISMVQQHWNLDKHLQYKHRFRCRCGCGWSYGRVRGSCSCSGSCSGGCSCGCSCGWSCGCLCDSFTAWCQVTSSTSAGTIVIAFQGSCSCWWLWKSRAVPQQQGQQRRLLSADKWFYPSTVKGHTLMLWDMFLPNLSLVWIMIHDVYCCCSNVWSH